MLTTFDKFIRYEKNGGGDPPADDAEGDAESEGKDVKAKKDKDKAQVFTQEQVDKIAGDARIAARKKAQEEFDAKEKKAKEEADKKKLEEQGEFKELTVKAEKERDDAKAEAEAIRKENRTLKLETSFTTAVEDLEYGFVSKQAAKDAYALLDQETVGEDGAGMKKAVEKLYKDRPYLFDEETDDETPSTDAKQKGKRPSKEQLDKDTEAVMKSRYRIRTPR